MKRVLIVDDFPDAAEALTRCLSARGHECQFATTGRAALAMARSFAIDVAIIDIGLPDVDGHHVARRLRQLPTTRTALLVAMTGLDPVEMRVRAHVGGFDMHLTKPIPLGTLLDIVSRARI